MNRQSENLHDPGTVASGWTPDLRKPDHPRFVASDQREGVWRRAGFPRRHCETAGTVSEWPDNQYAAGTILVHAIQDGHLAIVIGGRGVGKTLIATAACKQALFEFGYRPRYWTFTDLCADYRSQVYNGETQHGQWMATIEGYGALVIDECQDRLDTQFEAHLLNQIVDRRYRGHHGATILIANATEASVMGVFGSSIMDRMEEGAGLIVLNGPSLRMENDGQ